jgi:hypothetical protein
MYALLPKYIPGATLVLIVLEQSKIIASLSLKDFHYVKNAILKSILQVKVCCRLNSMLL